MLEEPLLDDAPVNADPDFSLLEGKLLHRFLNPDRIFYPGDPRWPGDAPRIDEIAGYTFAG